MSFLYLKALHIIFVVTWFAGLFYIVRLFIYQTEAYQKDEATQKVLIPQFKLMSRRLWFGITWPSAILTLIFGLSVLHIYLPNLPTWLWIKLGFVAVLYFYHLYCHKIFKQLQRDKIKFTSQQLRIWNEVSSLLLVSIVFLVVV
ncbi:CopD family protein, partial [Xanthovirga aplysinae]|uniref:CopD family protein n=1 Tax=Xanthovirga aplysinae TaxID=2529853 RepID=UPI0012BC5D45